MQLISMVCPNCGANLEIKPTLKEAYCQYCGAKLLIDGMQSTNQMGQPIADRNLLELLKAVSPLLANIESLESSLNENEAKLKIVQQKYNGLSIPLLSDEELHNFSLNNNKKLQITAIVAVVLLIISFFIAGIYGAIIVIILCIIGAFVFYNNIKLKLGFEKEIEKTKNDIEQERQTLIENKDTLSRYNVEVIPKKYRNSKTIDFLYNVLNDQRATTMQEAINIFEEEQRNRKMDEMQKLQLENLQRIEALAKENAAMRNQMNSQRNRK